VKERIPRPPARRAQRAAAALLSWVVLVAGCSSNGTSDPATTTSSGSNADRPNIVLVLVDDLDVQLLADLSESFPAFGDLVASGAMLTNYFVADSLCCPSRATTLRGQYDHNTGINPGAGFARFYELGREDSTIATWLHDAGYRTALFGKYLNEYPEGADANHVPPGWDEFVSDNGGNPYAGYNYRLNDNGRTKRHGVAEDDFLTDVLAERATEFIHRQAAEAPFFLYVAPYSPHLPATPSPRDTEAFADLRAPAGPAFDETDVADKPEFIAAQPALTADERRGIDFIYRRRAQAMLSVDRLLGAVVDALESEGELDDTYVVFTSDNGFHLGEHRLGAGKQTAYQEDISVPFVIRGPNVAAGSTVDDLAVNTDLAPTFAAMGGIEAADFVDGRSLLPLLLGSAPGAWRSSFLVEHKSRFGAVPNDDTQATIAPAPETTTSSGGESALPPSPAAIPDDLRPIIAELAREVIPSYFALRTDDLLYVEWGTGAVELYDLRADVDELDNLAGTAPADLLDRLHERLGALETCQASTCRELEDQDVPIATGSG